jgi:multidrug efflux pump subunit AcrA (membrane-fusion protein)
MSYYRNERNWKKIFFVVFVVVALLAVLVGFIVCSQPTTTTKQQVPAPAKLREITVIVDGNLVMPKEVQLRFGTFGTIKKIFVKEGDRVNAGMLLARLDDISKRAALAAAQYDLQIAMNNLEAQVPCQAFGYPLRYPDNTALLLIVQAQEEVSKAARFMDSAMYADAASNLRLVRYELERCLELLKVPEKEAKTGLSQSEAACTGPDCENIPLEQRYPALFKAMAQVTTSIKSVQIVENDLGKGNYKPAAAGMVRLKQELEVTHATVNTVVGQIVRFGSSYPDSSTTLDYLKAARKQLEQLQSLLDSKDPDALKVAEVVRQAQIDLEIGNEVLSNNELFFENGLSMKTARLYNLNVQKAKVNLQNCKDELLKTEIRAPFSGVIVDVGVKENDQLSAYDYASIRALHLVDTGNVEMKGNVDEIDIFKVKVGQKAVIKVDALPDKEFSGTLTFVSPFATEKSGVVNYAVKIALDEKQLKELYQREGLELKGGLTATARIAVGN